MMHGGVSVVVGVYCCVGIGWDDGGVWAGVGVFAGDEQEGAAEEKRQRGAAALCPEC